MITFTLDHDLRVRAFAAAPETTATTNLLTFCSERELATIAADWPMARLVAVWNALPGVTPVLRFMNRHAGIKRLWSALQTLPVETPAPPAARLSKKAVVLGLLARPNGAPISELMTATGWQIHSVRGFLSTAAKNGGVTIAATGAGLERTYRATALVKVAKNR